MGWRLTDDVARFEREAGEFLRADPVENTVPLVILATMRDTGPDAYGPPLFGWWGEPVRGAFVRTGTYPVVLTVMPEEAARDLPAALGDRSDGDVTGVQGREPLVRAFTEASGRKVREETRMRLYALDRLRKPEPGPPGTPRMAGAADLDLVYAWSLAFHHETAGAQSARRSIVADRIDHGGYALWEVDGTPVAMAGRTPVVEGTARVAPVYTPAEHRRKGYGAAVTAVITQNALDAGAERVVLFTDLANPTSNGIYQQIGYRAVSDRVLRAY